MANEQISLTRVLSEIKSIEEKNRPTTRDSWNWCSENLQGGG